MYPTTPTVQQWRSAAAALARSSGVSVPDWYTGQDADIGRLNSEGLTDLVSTLQWFQKAYAVEHPADFPDNIVNAAKDFIAKNPNATAYGSNYKLESYGIGNMAGDFAKEVGKNAVDLATHPVDYVKKNFTGVEAVKADPKGFGLIVLVGITAGAVAWWAFGRRAA